jgi:DNA replication and repair protein RecF
MDWGLFHVEPGFLPLWRRYARALRQRNALLKQGAPSDQLEVWDLELVAAGEGLTDFREAYLRSLQDVLQATSAQIAPMLGHAGLQFLPGWKRESMSLADALLLARDRDRMLGHTSTGPHRADWRVEFASMPHGEALSRGQAKLAALSCLLSQARHLAERLGEWPVVALDDMASELDAGHRARVLATLAESGAQVFVTGTDAPEAPIGQPVRVFHVEQGRVSAA